MPEVLAYNVFVQVRNLRLVPVEFLRINPGAAVAVVHYQPFGGLRPATVRLLRVHIRPETVPSDAVKSSHQHVSAILHALHRTAIISKAPTLSRAAAMIPWAC